METLELYTPTLGNNPIEEEMLKSQEREETTREQKKRRNMSPEEATMSSLVQDGERSCRKHH